MLKGGFRTAFYIDDGASDEQHQAIGVYSGNRGGPVAERAKLVGEPGRASLREVDLFRSAASDNKFIEEARMR